jgi:RNA polymerase sigma-70 factor (ECF subfamily)
MLNDRSRAVAMHTPPISLTKQAAETAGDSAVAARIATGDPAALETLMRTHNAKLFRVARAILKDDAEAEDALQEAYLNACRHIADFRGGSRLTTWLTRIVINESLMRLRKQKRDRTVVPFSDAQADSDDPRDDQRKADMADERSESPPAAALRAEIRRALERRIDELPLAYRTVFIMREVEDRTVEETAECLDIPAATVRTRSFRARALLREALARDIDMATVEVFGFAGERCDRIVSRVLGRAFRATSFPAAEPP